MSRRVRTPSQWLKAVRRAPVTNSVKFFCSYLYEHMDGSRMVSRPRAAMAHDLGRDERTIDRYVTATRRAGLIDTVVRGQKGVTAVYQGTFPPPELKVLRGGSE